MDRVRIKKFGAVLGVVLLLMTLSIVTVLVVRSPSLTVESKTWRSSDAYSSLA